MAECTIYDKLRYIAETKDLIKTAIETQDVEVLESDTFRKYAEYITAIRKVASVNGETGDIILKTINGQNLVGEGNISIQGGEGGGGITEETDPIFTEWKNQRLITLGKNNVINIPEDFEEEWASSVLIGVNNTDNTPEGNVVIGNDITIDNGVYNTVIGTNNKSLSSSIIIGTNNTDNASETILIGESNTSNQPRQIVLGRFNNPTTEGEINIGAFTKSEEDTYFAISSGHLKESPDYNAFEIKQNDNIHIRLNGQDCVLQDKLNDIKETDLSDYYTKGEVYNKNEVNELIDGVNAGDVDLTNYYTKQEVDNKIPSLNGYATEQWVEDKNYLTEHQSLEDYAKKSDIPDVSKFITGVPAEYITEEELNGKGYLTAIPDTYVTDGELSTAISDKVSQNALNEAIEGVENKIPSLDGYATEQWVEDKKYLTEHQDLTEYAKKSELPSVEGLASEQWVNQQGFLKEHQSLEDYAKKSDIPTIPTSNTAFTNDAGFITLNEVPETDLSDYYTKEQTYSKDEVDGLLENSGSSTAGVEAINIGRDVQDWTQKTGIVSLYTQMYDGGYEVAADGMSFFGIKPADDTIIIEQGGGTANGCFRGTIRVNPDVLGGGSGNAPTLQEGKSGTTDNYIYSDGDQNSNNCVMASFALRNTASSTKVSIDGDVKLWGDTSFNGKTNTYINGATQEKAGVMTAEDKKNLDALVANSGNTGGSDLISIDANNSSKSLNVGSGNTGDLYGTILVGRNIVNKYNAAVLIGNGVTNTVGDRTNMTVNICNSLMADSSGNMYFWKNGKVEKLADYAVYKEWSGTQAEYNALGTYDDNTIYNIIEG